MNEDETPPLDYAAAWEAASTELERVNAEIELDYMLPARPLVYTPPSLQLTELRAYQLDLRNTLANWSREIVNEGDREFIQSVEAVVNGDRIDVTADVVLPMPVNNISPITLNLVTEEEPMALPNFIRPQLTVEQLQQRPLHTEDNTNGFTTYQLSILDEMRRQFVGRNINYQLYYEMEQWVERQVENGVFEPNEVRVVQTGPDSFELQHRMLANDALINPLVRFDGDSGALVDHHGYLGPIEPKLSEEEQKAWVFERLRAGAITIMPWTWKLHDWQGDRIRLKAFRQTEREKHETMLFNGLWSEVDKLMERIHKDICAHENCLQQH